MKLPAGRLVGIRGASARPVRLNGPLVAARELSRAWPDAELLVVEDAGHLGSEPGSSTRTRRSTGSRPPKRETATELESLHTTRPPDGARDPQLGLTPSAPEAARDSGHRTLSRTLR